MTYINRVFGGSMPTGALRTLQLTDAEAASVLFAAETD